MILDAQQLFSDAQALTTTAASTNLIDLEAAAYLFEGEPLAVVITVDVAADFSTGDETYTFAVQTDTTAAFASATTIASRAILAAALTIGSQHTLVVPVELGGEQFMRLYYTLAGTTPTVTVTAALMPLSMIQKNRVYPDNITIS